jgi:DNA-binding transcriptional ArsR family regulator
MGHPTGYYLHVGGRAVHPPRVGQLLLTPRQIDALAAYRAALADSGPAEVATVAEVCRRMGGISREAAYHHLGRLAAVGLVDWAGLRPAGRGEGGDAEEPAESERARIAAEIAAMRGRKMARGDR